MKKNIKRTVRLAAGMAAVASAVAAVQSVQAQVTISLSGSTAMRNFTTNDGFTFVEPGSTLTLSNGTYGGAAYWGSGTNSTLQLASKVAGFTNSGTGNDNVNAVVIQWHEQGSVEGVLDLVNDQIVNLPSNTGTRDVTSANPIWINRNKFTNQATINGYTLGAFGTPAGQQAVQMAISDVNGAQGFSSGSNGAGAAWNKTVGQVGYGKGNQVLTAPSATNLSGLGVVGGQVQLVSSSVLNIQAGTLSGGVTAGAGVWNTAGTDNLENNKVAATATLFVANPGTGLDKLNRTDAQWLQTSSRFSNGAGFNFTSRDVNSGTRNVAASNTGVDVSFAVGVNDGGTGATTETVIGSGIKFSNKTTGGNLRTTVQNNRLAVGTLGLSDALSSTQGGSTPLRGLDYSDSVDGSSGYVRANAQTIVDGTYTIWQNETYITVKAPDAQYGNTNGANILGDSLGDVKAVRSNILISSRNYSATTSANVFGPADALLINSFIPEELLLKSKTYDGINTTSANAGYNASNSATFLGNSFLTNKFNVGNGNSPTAITNGTGAKYASNIANGANSIGITDNGNGTGNYLLGNFSQIGTRDLASLKNALAASTALELLGAGTNATYAGNAAGLPNNTPVSYVATLSGGTASISGTKGDLIVLGDIAGTGNFDGKSLYQLAKVATLSDSTASDNLTFGGANTNSATLGDAIRNGVSRKNDALDYLNANATLQQKTEAAVNPTDPTSVANAFNKFDINHDGRVSRNDAAIVDKFVNADKTNLTTQVGATIATDGSVSTLLPAVQKSINLFDVGVIDGTTTITHGKYTVTGTAANPTITITTPGDFALIRQALGGHLQPGDTAFRGKVDQNDLSQIVSRGFYRDLRTTHKWSDGDFNGDGKVDQNDLTAIVSAGTYRTGPYDGANPSVVTASVATPSLAGHQASSSATVGTVGNGVPLHFAYDAATGDVKLQFDGLAGNLQVLDLVSSSQQFLAATANPIFDGNISATNFSGPDELFSVKFTGTFANGLDLGNILRPNLSLSQLAADLTLGYTIQGQAGAKGDLIASGVPEPTTLSLLGLGAMGLLARRRRNA